MDQKLQRGTAASRPLVFRQAADATIPGPHPHCEGKNDRCLTTISSEPATSKKAPSVRSSTSYYTLGELNTDLRSAPPSHAALSSDARCNTPCRFDIGSVDQDLRECCDASLFTSVGRGK